MNKTLVGIIIGLLVIVIVLQGYSLFVRSATAPTIDGAINSTSTAPSESAKPATPSGNAGRPNIQTYRDTTNGFELDYDGSVFAKEIKDGYINVPPAPGAQKVSQVTFVRYASRPSYNGAGFKTQERTDNPRIRINIIPVAYPTYEAYIYETFDTGSIETIFIGGRKGIRYWMGAEGEGSAYYCVPLQDAKTLCISHNTLDGDFVRAYRDVPDFISLARQRTLAESVMSTVTFIK